MVPIPVLRISRRREGKAGKMKTDPAASFFHVLLKGGTLCCRIGPGIQEQHYLVLRQQGSVQLVPVIGGVVNKIIFGSHPGQPFIGLMHITDMRLITFGCIKSDDFKRGCLFCASRALDRPRQKRQQAMLRTKLVYINQ